MTSQPPSATAPTGPTGASLPPWLREILRCPACRSELGDGTGRTGGPELQCLNPACGLAYRVDDGIPVLLVDEARPTRG